jgi:hypothetical protein
VVVGDVVHYILQFRYSGFPKLDEELHRLDVSDDEILERVSYTKDWRFTMGRTMRTRTIEDSMNPSHNPFLHWN